MFAAWGDAWHRPNAVLLGILPDLHYATGRCSASLAEQTARALSLGENWVLAFLAFNRPWTSSVSPSRI